MKRGLPESGVWVVFGFENGCEEGVLLSDNSPSGVGQKANVDKGEIPDAQASFVFWLANVSPSPEVYRAVLRVVLDTSPPEFPNDGIDFGEEFFGEDYVGHVVHWYGGKDRVDVG